MKCTPFYGIFYNDGYHEAGRPFEIDEKDAEEMAKHGRIEGARQEQILEEPEPVLVPKPKRTRKPKAE